MEEDLIEKKKLSKIQRMRRAIIFLKSKDKKTMKGKKTPKKLKKLLKKKRKKPGYVVVQYLTSDYEIQFKLCKIVSGDLVVVENKVHKLNPKKVWRHGKDSFYILREIDRQPVSNEDYEEVRDRGDDTDADVPLIKAVLGAVQKSSGINAPSKNVIIIIAVIAAVVIGAILFMK